jgi:hypothetical protein
MHNSYAAGMLRKLLREATPDRPPSATRFGHSIDASFDAKVISCFLVRLHGRQASTSSSVPDARTLQQTTSSYAGGARTFRVRMSNFAPCKGQITATIAAKRRSRVGSRSWPAIAPSAAKHSPSMLNRAICVPFTSISRAWPGSIASASLLSQSHPWILPLMCVHASLRQVTFCFASSRSVLGECD